MPGKKTCSRILDPAERRKCESYQGKYSNVQGRKRGRKGRGKDYGDPIIK